MYLSIPVLKDSHDYGASIYSVWHKYLPACPGKWIFEKMASGKYILDSPCPNGKLIFWAVHTHFYTENSAQIHKNMQTMQQNKK